MKRAKFDEAEIQKMMKNLSLSREEAIQLLQDDANDITQEISMEQQKVVNEMMRGDKKPRECKRKPNEMRRCLISEIAESLEIIGCTDVEVTHVERQIMFVYKGEKYRMDISKPRKPKDEED